MRLNEKTYPAYATLESGKVYNLNIDAIFSGLYGKTFNDLMDFTTGINEVYKQVANRYYLTGTFVKAIETAMPKIAEKQKHYNELPSDCGIIFAEGGFTIYLSMPADKKLKFVAYGFSRDCLTTFGFVSNEGIMGGVAASVKDGKEYNDREHLFQYLNSVMMAVYFIHNCETEVKVLQPNEKHRENGNKHYNESKSNVKVLDCRWFTELIRDTPFHVKGHLRWQACGEKFKKRKLTWVADYEKKGYHRKAGKESV